MKEKVKILLNKIIYERLELNAIEHCIIEAGVKPKEIVNNNNYDLTSKYFFLVNDVYLDRLNTDELQILENLIGNIDFQNINLTEELIDFMNANIYKLLLPNTDEKYLSYYGTGYDYMAPSDSIVLGFHYIKYLDNNENDINKKEEVIYEKMNYIQSVLGPAKKLKVSVLIFDELINEKNKTF